MSLKQTDTTVRIVAGLITGLLMASCSAYRQNIMFQTKSGALQQEVQKAESNYVIQKNDYLQIDIYTNEGERIIDPDFKLAENSDAQLSTSKPQVSYLVDVNGIIKVPLIGELKVEGLTVRETEKLLQKEYEKFYTKPFAVVKYTNKRVVVLGAPGGHVIPLANENTRLVEILALAQGIDNNAKVNNIRLLRNEDVFVIDLSTIEGYKKGNMIMEPGDIVYVEPIRKPVSEAVRDYGPLVSIVTSLVTLIVIITR